MTPGHSFEGGVPPTHETVVICVANSPFHGELSQLLGIVVTSDVCHERGNGPAARGVFRCRTPALAGGLIPKARRSQYMRSFLLSALGLVVVAAH